MTTLREAREKGKLDQFIAEHEGDKPGDLDRFDDAIRRSAKESAKADREASKQADTCGCS